MLAVGSKFAVRFPLLEPAWGRKDDRVGGNRPTVKSRPIEEPDCCKATTLGLESVQHSELGSEAARHGCRVRRPMVGLDDPGFGPGRECLQAPSFSYGVPDCST